MNIKSSKEKRYKNDKLYRVKIKMRQILNNSIRSGEYPKNSKFSKFYGCSINILKNHLEQSLMTICNGNYGQYWEIDYIIPLHSANDLEELVYLNHYTNLQPLTIEENRAKSDFSQKVIKNFI